MLLWPVWRTQSATQAVELSDRGCRSGGIHLVGAENLEHGKMSGNLSAGIWLGPGDTGESLEFLSRIILIIRMIWLQSAG